MLGAAIAGAGALAVAAYGGQTGALACVSGHLAVSLGPPVVPMTGEHADLFEVANRSSRPCVLDGYPRLSLSHAGERVAFIYHNGGGMYVTRRRPRRITLAPGHHGYFLVAKYRCDAGDLYAATAIRVVLPAPPTRSTTLRLSEPGAGELDYCKRYPGDQAVDPGNRVNVSPVEASALATRLPVP